MSNSGSETMSIFSPQLAARFDGPLNLLGWSLGGMAAQRWALREPGKIGKLILVASTPCFANRAGWECGMAQEVLAQFAGELYCYRIRKYLGAYLAVLEGCDGIVFGGGVGEHVPGVRARALSGLAFAGVTLDTALNDAARGGAARISAPGAAIALHVIVPDEELVLARAAAALL